jgi:hypothetical protein
MSMGEPTVALDPADPAAWAAQPCELLFTLSRDEVAGAQLEAVARRFERLRPSLAALDKLASRQGVERIDSFEDALPVYFDHRVLKSYPLSLIENRDFDRLTGWLQRLTTHDLSTMSREGLGSVDDWLQRLDDNGMIMLHSTGTTGKLSFIPRSQAEWPAWTNAYFEAQKVATGVDLREVEIPTFTPMYRTGHQTMAKMHHLFADASAGGEANRHVLYDYAISADLLSLAGRLQGAEERGELDQLQFDPELLAHYKELIERGRHRDDDLERWFFTLADEYRHRRVVIRGTAADLVRLAMTGRERGIICEFTPDSVLIMGGGMKGFRDAPADWRELVTNYFGVGRICTSYGMSECIGIAPKCREGYFHFLPYVVPTLLDENAVALESQGVQTGRLALFDLLAESYWGGFISGDRVTIHWDEDCACGWKGPRAESEIARFAQMEGGDDKITCAGTAQAYNAFMDYVSSI